MSDLQINEIDPHEYCSLQRTTKGKYRARVKFNDFETGKERNKYFHSKVDAVDWIEGDFAKQCKKSLGFGDQIETFRQVFQFYIDESKIGRSDNEPLEDGSIDELERYLRLHLEGDPLLDMEVVDTTPQTCALFVRRRRESLQQLKAVRYMKAACKYAKEEFMISENPFADVRIPKPTSDMYSETDTNKDIPAKSVVRDLLENARSTVDEKNGQYRLYAMRFFAMLGLAAYAGLRTQEIRALRVSDIDFDRGYVEIRQAIAHGKTSVIKKPKTKAGTRDIPMSGQLRTALSEWLEERAEPSDDVRQLCFPTRTGKPISYSRMGKYLSAFLDEHGVEDLAWHGLRHFYASNLISENIDLLRLKTYMGHSSVQTTLDIYGHLMKEQEPFTVDV